MQSQSRGIYTALIKGDTILYPSALMHEQFFGLTHLILHMISQFIILL
jgi:hypothetical protein